MRYGKKKSVINLCSIIDFIRHKSFGNVILKTEAKKCIFICSQFPKLQRDITWKKREKFSIQSIPYFGTEMVRMITMQENPVQISSGACCLYYFHNKISRRCTLCSIVYQAHQLNSMLILYASSINFRIMKQ